LRMWVLLEVRLARASNSALEECFLMLEGFRADGRFFETIF
jgi:hypothetical protein